MILKLLDETPNYFDKRNTFYGFEMDLCLLLILILIKRIFSFTSLIIKSHIMKIKFGAIVTDGRGKIGGHVASKNRGGSYLRTKVTPSNPQTASQSSVRSRLTTFSQGWKGLTQAQRDAWNGAVSNFTSTNIFGDIKQPTGLNLYIKLNSNLAEITVAAITLPPLPSAVEGVSNLSATGAAGTPALSVVFGPSPVAVGDAFIVRATPQVSPGKSFLKNLYRNIDVLVAADTTPADILAVYVAKFGTLVAGQKIGIELVPINAITGQKGSALSTTLIVAA